MKKMILVTGATGSIGRTLCEHLIMNGHRLILAARNTNKLENLSQTIQQQYNCTVDFASIDFDNTESFTSLIAKTAQGIDGLVLMPPQPPETKDCLPEDAIWHSLFKASFIGPVALIKSLLPALKKKSGSVVMLSGISSKQPLSQYATSNVLRTTWLGQIKTLADVYGEHGLRFNTLSLGGILTDKFMEKIKVESLQNETDIPSILKERFSNIPLRRYAEIKELSDMINFLINSAASKHLTGQNIAFDGGFTRPY